LQKYLVVCSWVLLQEKKQKIKLLQQAIYRFPLYLLSQIHAIHRFPQHLLYITRTVSDTPRLQYYDVQTLEYRYISKLPMKNERIWSYIKETTSHLQNKLTKNIHLGVATSTRPPFSWKYKLIISPSKF
jgi:hypothetical protein